VRVYLGRSDASSQNNRFKTMNLTLAPRCQMSVTLTEDRLRRLVDSGLRGSCRPSDRVSQLRKRAKQTDDLTLRRLEAAFFGLADSTRLRILKLLGKEELCACEVMAALDLTQPTTSHHLGILERSGLVASRREGKWVFYRLSNPRVAELLTKSSSLVKEVP
jgi:ArsR family transcriptional regulator